MTAVDPESSAERWFCILQVLNPGIRELLLAETQPKFIDATEHAIERAIRRIENASKEYSKLGERGLSQLLVDFLSSAGYRATAETNNNGHVDVLVEDAFGRGWRYLGECKLYRGYKYHVDGCEQLLGYCTGRDPRAFLMGFFDRQGGFTKMDQLRVDLDARLPLQQTAQSCGHRISGAFLTCHKHESGFDVEILHLACAVPKSP